MTWGLKGNTKRIEQLKIILSRGCPRNCMRRARFQGTTEPGVSVFWEGGYRARTREPGDLPS